GGAGEISTGLVTESDVLNAFKNILKCVPTDSCIATTIIIAESAISVSGIVGSIVEATRLKSQNAGAGVLVAAAITIERTCTNCGVGLTASVILEGPSTERRFIPTICQAKEGVSSRGRVT